MLRLVRTDYRFASRAEALDTLLFFFGKGVAARAASLLADAPPDAPCDVPECTLLCWRYTPPEAKPPEAPHAALPAQGAGQVPAGVQVRHAVAGRIRGWLTGRRARLWLCAYLAVGALATSLLIGMGKRRRR